MNRTSTSSVTPHRAYGSIPQPNLLWPRVLPFYFSVSGPWEHGSMGAVSAFLLIESISLLSLLTEPEQNLKSGSYRESRVGDIFI